MSGMAMPGMTMGGHGGHPSGGLPGWMGLTWALAFAVLLAWHARYAWRSHGAGRAWHAGHVVMAATMCAAMIALVRMLPAAPPAVHPAG